MQRTNLICGILSVMGLLVAPFLATGQVLDTETQAALEVARAHTERFVTASFPKGDATHHFVYTITSTPLATVKGASTTQREVAIVVGRERLQLKSATMDFYQNTEHSVVIAHASRAIIIAPSTQEAQLQRNTDVFAQQQLALFNAVERAELGSYPNANGGTIKHLVLHLDCAGQALYNCDRMDFHYDANSLKVVRTVMHYNNHKELQQQAYDFTLLEYNSPTRFDAAPLEQIYGANGQLRQQYQDYQLINQTNL